MDGICLFLPVGWGTVQNIVSCRDLALATWDLQVFLGRCWPPGEPTQRMFSLSHQRWTLQPSLGPLHPPALGDHGAKELWMG